jgi:dTDP-L-rhamnose 4-epimerase
MRTLVTGGAGFIGSHVVSALADAGHEVLVMDALLDTVHPAGEPSIDRRAKFVRGDVRERADCGAVLGGVDVVFHEAAMVGLGVDMADLPAYAGHNDLGTAVLLAEMAAKGVRRLVLASSMVIYGEGAYECPTHGAVHAAPRRPQDLDAGSFEPPCPMCGSPLSPSLVQEHATPDPRNAYATSKLAQEHYAGGWARETGSTAIALRYHNVYGPGMPRDTPYAGVAAIFRSALENGQAPRVFEDGGQLRDFVHVTDVATANVAALQALETRAAGSFRAYNVGSGTPHTVGQMASALCDEAGNGIAPMVTGAYRLGDVRHIMADSSRARREFQWSAAVTFEQGMHRFVSDALRGPAAAGR